VKAKCSQAGKSGTAKQTGENCKKINYSQSFTDVKEPTSRQVWDSSSACLSCPRQTEVIQEQIVVNLAFSDHNR